MQTFDSPSVIDRVTSGQGGLRGDFLKNILIQTPWFWDILGLTSLAKPRGDPHVSALCQTLPTSDAYLQQADCWHVNICRLS